MDAQMMPEMGHYLVMFAISAQCTQDEPHFLNAAEPKPVRWTSRGDAFGHPRVQDPLLKFGSVRGQAAGTSLCNYIKLRPNPYLPHPHTQYHNARIRTKLLHYQQEIGHFLRPFW